MIHHIQSIIQRQVSLDRCTGGAVLKLRAVSVTMDHSYERLDVYRAMVIAVSTANPLMLPEAIQLFRKAARVEQLIQKNAKQIWEVEEKMWNGLIFLKCKIPWMSHASSFPAFPFRIIDPEISLLELTGGGSWKKMKRTSFRLRVEYGKLRSEAELERKNHGWTVAWIL